MMTRSPAQRDRYSLASQPAHRRLNNGQVARLLALFAFVAFTVAQPGHAVARAILNGCIALFTVIVHAA